MESDFSNAISWVLLWGKCLGKFYFHLRKIAFRISSFQISFNHVGQTADCIAGPLARHGVDGEVSLSAHIF